MDASSRLIDISGASAVFTRSTVMSDCTTRLSSYCARPTRRSHIAAATPWIALKRLAALSFWLPRQARKGRGFPLQDGDVPPPLDAGA